MEQLIGIFTLLVLAGLAYRYVPIALSTLFIIKGRLNNNEYLIVLDNKNFSRIEFASQTDRLTGGSDPVKKWKITAKTESGVVKTERTFHIGEWPIYTAQKVYVPINRIEIIRPTTLNERVEYRFCGTVIHQRPAPRFITHGFETSECETKSETVGDATNNHEFITFLTMKLRVEIEVFNAYLAYVKIPSTPSQNFMEYVNGALQSTARQVIAKFTYEQIVRAIIEQEDGQTVDPKSFGEIFKGIINEGLKEYGVRINNLDMLDHSVDEETRKAITGPQKAHYGAKEVLINAEASKKAKQLEAEGDASELKEILDAVKGDTMLAALEINRRGMQRSAEGVGRSFKGQFLTVNFGAGPAVSGPTPAVTVGNLEPKDTSGNRPHKRDDKKKN